MSKKPMTEKQKELKRIRDRKYRERKRMEKMASMNKKTAEMAKSIAKKIKASDLTKKTKAVCKETVKLPKPKKATENAPAKKVVINKGDLVYFKNFSADRIIDFALRLMLMAAKFKFTK